MLVIQVPLQLFQQTAVRSLTGLIISRAAPQGDARPQLSLPPQRSAHLQGLGSLCLQLDLELLEASVEAQALPFSLLGEPGRGLALLFQGHGEMSQTALLILQSELQVLERESGKEDKTY